MDVESIRHAYLRRLVAPVFRACGFRFTRGVARRLAAGVARLEPPGRRRAADRVAAALGLGPDDATVAERVAAMYRHQGDFWAEALFVGRLLTDRVWRRHVRIDGESRLRALADDRRGCILTTAYYGNPAVAACGLGRMFEPVHVIVDWLAQPRLHTWQRELYRQPGVRPLGRAAASREIPGILERGGAVLMIAEHERRTGRTVAVDFLGRRLNLYPTIGRLARWFDVPVAAVTCRRTGAGYGFELACCDVVRATGRDDEEAGVVRRVMAALERSILRDPAQYLWSIETLGGAPQGDRARRKPAEGGRATTTGTETETARSRRSRRTGSASQWTSAEGRSPGAAVAGPGAGPVPTG